MKFCVGVETTFIIIYVPPTSVGPIIFLLRKKLANMFQGFREQGAERIVNLEYMKSMTH